MFFQYTKFPPSSLFTAFSLWTQAFRHNNHDVAHRAQKLDGKPPAPAPIRARARYAEFAYLFGDFHPSHIQEYAGGPLLALEKPAKDGGDVRPIICGESWRRCFASLAANAVRGHISRIFTSTYENFLQTAGLQDGASHGAKILSSMYAALNSDPSDPDVDISNAFNALSTRCAAS